MAFSQMTSKEKTAVAILSVVILISLIGLGFVVARLVARDTTADQGPDISVPMTNTVVDESVPQATITPVDTPSLGKVDKAGVPPASGQPAVVVRKESVEPRAPVLIAGQSLQPGHRYRLEITAADGSSVGIHGSWSQAATSTAGEIAPPQIELFEGMTPFVVDLIAPVQEPDLWSCSVSAAPASVVGPAPGLVITIWDVTAAQ